MSGATPRLATREAFQAQPASVKSAVRFYGFQKVGGTGRFEATARSWSGHPGEEWRHRALIGADKNSNQRNH
jgi:hypothetical protein